MYLEKINEDGDVTGRTVVGIVSGGIGCGSSKKPNFPKWWARVRVKYASKLSTHYSQGHRNRYNLIDLFCEINRGI